MALFKRALWHSGLTYQQTCYHCHTVVRYTDYNLDFRPWYADGFIYCPRCKGPLRHSENYAIREDGTPYYPQPTPCSDACRCPGCGKTFTPGVDRFCSGCGQKLG